MDIGTGTGQAVLRRARREPESLVIGVDADASAMADASRRAAANVRKGGLPNALFLVESAERLPGLLASRADLVTVALPWGSLLRGVLDPDPAIVRGVRDTLHPDGEIVLFLSELDDASIAVVAHSWTEMGFHTVELREAVGSDVAALSSGWARRLSIPGSRPAWIIRLRRR